MQNTVQNTATGMGNTSKAILQNHLSAFQENDLEAILADFTEESVLITPDRNYTGLEAIRDFFTSLISHFPKQKSSFIVDTTVIKDELVYIVWHGKTPSLDIPFATDTFIIKNSKIHRQTFAGQINAIG